MNRSNSILNINSIRDSISNCSSKLLLKPDDTESLRVRGILRDLIHLHDLAIQDFSELIEKQPDVKHNYYLRAFSYCNKGEFQLAFQDVALAHSCYKMDIQGIQGNAVPQLIGFLINQRSLIFKEIELKLQRSKLKQLYGLNADYSLS